jgi:hypothetical protein
MTSRTRKIPFAPPFEGHLAFYMPPKKPWRLKRFLKNACPPAQNGRIADCDMPLHFAQN